MCFKARLCIHVKKKRLEAKKFCIDESSGETLKNDNFLESIQKKCRKLL